MDLDEVGTILSKLRTDHEWYNLDENYAKFLIILSAGEKELYSRIPHYYNLMYTLHCLSLGVESHGIVDAGDGKFWLEPAKKANSYKALWFYPNNSLFSYIVPIQVSSKPD